MEERAPFDDRTAKQIVREGWDRFSWVYRPVGTETDRFGRDASDHRAWLAPVLAQVPPGAPVLDLGCGAGVPATAILAERFRVTGVDISPVQVERARRAVPDATFVCADMTGCTFPRDSFEAVVCLYALIHVPLSEQRPLIGRIRDWLRPGGWLILTTGAGPYRGVETDWLGSGVTMFWDHAGAREYRTWLRAAGFTVIAEATIPEGGSAHAQFWLRRPR